MSVTEDIGNLRLLSATLRVPDGVVYRNFVHETVILNLETSRYHGVNTTGGAMLDALVSTGSVSAAAERLGREFGRPLEEIQVDLCELCEELLDRGLLVRVAG